MLGGTIKIAITDSNKEYSQFFGDPMNVTTEEEIKALALFMKKSLIQVARDTLGEEQRKGFDKSPVRTVDNVVGRSEEDVKAFGKIIYDSKVAAAEFLIPLYQGLLDRSRVDTGLYQDSHFVFFRGKLIANNIAELKAWIDSKPDLRDGARIRFVNVMPYASKLERTGDTATKRNTVFVKAKDKRQRSGAKVRRPNGAYYLTAKALNRKYKNNSLIKFEWINGRSMNLSGVPITSRSGKLLRTTFSPKSGRKGFYVYPSISITISGGGIIA